MSKIECGQLHIELFGHRNSTLQSHGLFALAKHLLRYYVHEVFESLPFDLVSMSQAYIQAYIHCVSPNFGEIDLNIYEDIVFTVFSVSLPEL